MNTSLSRRAFRSAGFALALALVAAPGVPARAAEQALPKRITFVTLPIGSGNYSIANALAKVAFQHSGMMVVTRPGSGASAWVGSTNAKGTPEMGLMHVLDAWWAFSGKLSPTPLPGDPYGVEPFYPPNPNLRMLIAGPRQWVGLLTEAAKPWKTVAEAKGATLAGGFSAHPGAYAGLVALLSAANLQEQRDFRLISVATSNASIKAYGEGRAELALGSVGNAAVSEANATRPLRFLNASTAPEDMARARAAFPGSHIAIYPEHAPGVEPNTALLTYPMLVVASTHMPDEAAYALTKAWWEHHQETWPVYSGCKGWTDKDFVVRNATIPYHEGAIRFFREVGAWSPEMDRIQAELLDGKYPFLNMDER